MEEKEPTIHENPSPDDGATVLHDHKPAGHIAPGSKIGHYTIREVLGEGGFAVVYLAEQTQPVRRRVALKVIKLGMDTKQVIARFEAERQALAMMDHPCVAKVFDAGVTDDGRSYFVMEHVPGVPITEHCDRQRLNIEQRLQLFMSVCDAVQHAHQKGIIHRDLKPGNVLVSVKEGSAVPKVIDFGVAKALHQKLTEKTLFTEQGQLIGTPEYMSPEQAEMTAQDIDTRSDIYSLGVLLYELLTGALPFDPKSLRKAAFAEIQRIIREEEPPKPSTKLSSLGDASTTNADKRRLDPRSLMRELRGDLDWIVMKALEKDRQHRYETANALAMDLQRHLAHEPVLAGPPSATYKLRKFVRRNRGAVAAAGVVLGVLVLGVAGTTWGWVEAIDARDAESDARAEAQQRQQEAEVAGEEALRQAGIAQTINDFLTDDLLAAVAPSAKEGRGKDVLMRDVLDVAAKRIEHSSGPGGRFEDKPLVEASIRQTLGHTYYALGEYPAAEPHLERARMLRRRELGEEHQQTLGTMNDVANLYTRQGRYEEAEPLYLQTLEIQERMLGEEHPTTLTSRNNLALLYNNQGRYDEAEPLHVKTLEIQKRILREEHPDTLISMHNLAIVYERQGRYDEAEPLYIKTLEIENRVLGEEHPDTLNSMNNLAGLYQRQGRDNDAESLYVKTLEIQKRVLGEEHPDTLASGNNLAGLYQRQGRDDVAEPLYVKTLQIMKRVLGEEHPETLASMGNLASLYVDQGEYAEAEPLYLQTLEIQKRVRGEEHPETLISINNLAELFHLQARYEEAATLFAQAVAGAREAWPARHWITGAILGGYGETLTALQRYKEAETALLEAHELIFAGLGPDHERTIGAIKSLSDLYTAWHEAEPNKGFDAKAAEWCAKLPEPGESAPGD